MAMESSPKASALLLILMLAVSTISPVIACGSCSPKPPSHRKPKSPTKHPITLPPVLPKPPVTIPPILPKPPITIPKTPITLPPVVPPPPVVPLPPVVGGGSCPPPPAEPTPTPPATCPADSLKIGACVDVLGLVHGVIGDPVVNHCCPVLGGLLELEAAVCLCTHIKLKLLDINIYLPIALQLLLTCGKAPPAGFTCPN